MKTTDFARSFLTFRIDTLKKPPLTTSHKSPHTLNNARVQLDCRCEVLERQGGTLKEFVLGANCKTERVGVDQDLFTEPNADFIPIFSRETFMNLKAFDRVDKGVMFYPPSRGVQPERQVGQVAEAFDGVQIDLYRSEGESLETADKIIEATLAGHPLVAQTEMKSERYTALIEYPVKTINVDERDKIYQTDTGPILFPDLSCPPEELIGEMELAFVAFNCPEWAEFILRVKAELAKGVSVYHYSKRVRVEARSQILRIVS